MDAATYMYLLSTDIWFENLSHFAPYMRFCLDRLQQINADPSGNTPVNVRLPHLMPAAAREATAVCVVFVKLWQCVLCVTLLQVPMPITLQPTVAVQHASALFSEVQITSNCSQFMPHAQQLSAVINAAGPHTQVLPASRFKA